jgi:hypothetical protein
VQVKDTRHDIFIPSQEKFISTSLPLFHSLPPSLPPKKNLGRASSYDRKIAACFVGFVCIYRLYLAIMSFAAWLAAFVGFVYTCRSIMSYYRCLHDKGWCHYTSLARPPPLLPFTDRKCIIAQDGYKGTSYPIMCTARRRCGFFFFFVSSLPFMSGSGWGRALPIPSVRSLNGPVPVFLVTH